MNALFSLNMLMLVMLVSGAVATQRDPASDQLVLFKENTTGPIGILTTSAGAPVPYEEATNTLNSRLIFNQYFMDSITHINRERIPERVVHAKGTGAFGYFEVTHDITNICKARLFSRIGKKTPVAVRFSIGASERGSSDSFRGSRGFAVKFNTKDGIFDIVGFSTPMFVFNDPRLFVSFNHAQRRNPAHNLLDPIALWDFLTLQPESLHIFLLTLGDRGIPYSYRHMPGFGIHTFQVENEHGDIHFIRFHFIPDAGIKTLKSEEARKIGAEDPDFSTRDLYRAIGSGNFPSWTVSIQVLSLKDVKAAGFNVFDVTLVLPLDDYPLKKLGKLVLNRNAVNYFAEIEQLAFCPANLVPGILGGPDKIFEARRLAYRDAQYYRLGANFNKIPVNCPFRTKVLTYNKDGRPPVNDNGGDSPKYYPNSFNGPVPYIDKNRVPLIEITEEKPNIFKQATELYVNEMTCEERTRLIQNILKSLGSVTQFIQDRAIKLFKKIHPDLGSRIEQGLSSNDIFHNVLCGRAAEIILAGKDLNDNAFHKDMTLPVYHQQIKRTVFISNVWCNAHMRSSTDKLPENYGFTIINNKYQYYWFDDPQSPSFEVISSDLQESHVTNEQSDEEQDEDEINTASEDDEEFSDECDENLNFFLVIYNTQIFFYIRQ